MLAPLLLLLLPFLTSACFCPSCGCSCCSGYNNYYSQNSGGYQNNGAVGYGQPYTVFFNQPIPAGPGVEVRAPLASQQAPSQFLPPLQSPPQFPPQQYAQPQYPPPQQAPQLVQPRVTYVQAPQITVPAQQPAQPANNYELPIVQKPNVGFQPSRQVETLNRRPNVVSGPAETTVAPYTGTTKIVPAKQGKNKDYEYYYVYYDEDGKKVPGKSTAKPLHDGSIRQRATTAAPQNSIDEYDFEDTKASVEGQIPVTTRAPILNVNPITVTVATPKTTEFVEPEGEVHLIDEITTIPTIPVPVQTTPAAREPQPVQEEEDSDGDAIYEDELGGTTNKATVTTTKGQVVTFETLAPTTTKLTTTSVPARATVTTTATTTTTGDSKNYEYEEYEVEEIQLINENGVTETVTRIITTTKAPPKQ